MASFKTQNLLPETFRTESNQKFLNATLDQLISEPNFKKVNGYIGRTFAPTYKVGDSYVTESTAERQHYQVEPSVVVKNTTTNEIDFYASYTDLVNKVKFYGGNVANHSRLFNSETYSYGGNIDFDKLINFSQYQWLPNGPDSVTVSALGVPTSFTWDAKINPATGTYYFTDGSKSRPNAELVLARGGVYTFNIDATSGPFWIQSQTGISGVDPLRPNIVTRTVFGVVNNGSSSGTVTFRVPLVTSQSKFSDMATAATVDYATALTYKEIQGITLSDLNSKFGGLDGHVANCHNKTVIFVSNRVDDYDWTIGATVIPVADRVLPWLITVGLDEIVTITKSTTPVAKNTKVYVRSGTANATKHFYVDYYGLYVEVPLLTALLDTLYYQSGTTSSATGAIKIVEVLTQTLDPAVDILGKVTYISPNGVTFTNGSKVTFDNTAPSTYANKTYYVSGVGTAIRLTLIDNLVATALVPDYITIDRASIDGNAWARSNRWFHTDVMKAAAAFNGTEFSIDQTLLAKRPIIEFAADLALYNYGSIAKAPVNILDTAVTTAYTQIENVSSSSSTVFTKTINGQVVSLAPGDRVIFSNDLNLSVRNKIYVFTIADIGDAEFNHIYVGKITEADDSAISANHGICVSKNSITTDYWFNGVNWVTAQRKIAVNQAPLFDVFDQDGISFGDALTYVNTNFVGSKVFSYKANSGANDPILGFPLSYRSFNNVGDIQFTNNFDTDQVAWLTGSNTTTSSINIGTMHRITGLTTAINSNGWNVTSELSKQYQLISHVADGINNLFEIDVLPDTSVVVPNIKVILNGKHLSITHFGLSQIGVRYAVIIDPAILKVNDSIDILIYSTNISQLGFYQIPANLDNNAANDQIDSVTLGQMRNHVISLFQNSMDVVGSVPGSSNLRDVNLSTKCGAIVKQSAPLIYSELFLIDSTMNFVDANRLAQREYVKFKNKFLEIATKTDIDTTDIAGAADSIIKTINGFKNSSFSWYYSDMVPQGDARTILAPYVILDPRIKSYELTSIFDDTKLSNKAVLVYLTRIVDGKTVKSQLTKNTDYSFGLNFPAIVIADSFNLNFDDVLTIVEYNSTDGNYVPETPTKLGLYPKFGPAKMLDSTYLTPTWVIQGHDGSITPAFNDYRDDLLLELELRIYNNIKVTYDESSQIDFWPGKFRTTEYSLGEFNQILTNSFMSWVGNNRLDFTTNNYFQSNNAWTWNYKNFKDTVDGAYLPGTWRAVFKWMYDTDRPHTHPWEMLGFSERPSWWTTRYGPAPFTGGNLTLWTDLSNGYIHSGPRAGIDLRYARPGLLSIIPVDDAGNLMSPEKYAVLDFDSAKANASYSVGDQGPVETAWRRSSEYAFAMQIALALAKPGYYFSKLINIDQYKLNASLNQFIVMSTGQHITPSTIVVNGDEAADGTIARAAGYLNWIADYLRNLGIAAPHTKIKETLMTVTVQLAYKVAGFTDKKFLTIIAEQGSPSSTSASVVVPDENYNVILNKSVPVDKIVYSAVIVERSANGYTVSGYNLTSPYFTIVPSHASNDAYTVTAGTATGIIYKDYQRVMAQIPYGFEFNSAQQVVDFLVSYQRYLQSQGFVFIDFDQELNQKKDWILSVREFLTWTLQGWSAGSVLVLSPVNDTIRVASTITVVDDIVNSPNGSKLLDPNFAAIKNSSFTVVRNDNNFSVTSFAGQTIALAELNLVQYEHVILFDNVTVFNDVIYSAATGNRQYRLKFIGYKTANWTGVLNPPGFIYNTTAIQAWEPNTDYFKGQLLSFKDSNYTALVDIIASDSFQTSSWKQIDSTRIKTGLLPNYATSAKTFESIYDIDNAPYDEALNYYSTGLIGFRNRSYLSELSMTAETQSKFYQGMIKHKGTKAAALALASAQINDNINDIAIYEEWAIRSGNYGSSDSNQFVEISISDKTITANPTAIQMLSNSAAPTPGIQSVRPNSIVKASKNNTPVMFDVYDTSADKVTLPTAGYVNLADVDATIFDMADYRTLSSTLAGIGTGYTIWTAKDFSGSWNVYRVTETGVAVSALTYSMDNLAVVSTDLAHNLIAGDIVAIKGFAIVTDTNNTSFDAFYQVYDVVDATNFTVALISNFTALRDAGTLYDSAILFKLTSSRIGDVASINLNPPIFGWNESDYLWVDAATQTGEWGVYQRTAPWTYNATTTLNSSEYTGNDLFGQTVKISADGNSMYVGASTNGTGRAIIFAKQPSGQWVENVTFVNGSTGTLGFGESIDVNLLAMTITAPKSNAASGRSFVYAYSSIGLSLVQVLTSPTPSAANEYGASICSSANGEWLYVSEPGINTVHVYAWRNHATTAPSTFPIGNVTGTLSETVTSANEILVTGSRPYVPGVEYSVVGSTVTWTPALTESVLVTYNSHYHLMTSITAADSMVGDKFGSSVSCDTAGSRLVIGASNATVSGVVGNGATYVYDRSIETFVARGTNNTFVPLRALQSVFKVTRNDITAIIASDYVYSNGSIILLTVPMSGTKIKVETNYFTLTQKLVGKILKSNQSAGLSTAICDDASGIYIGAPGYTTATYSSGAVYRYANTASLHSIATGTVVSPTVTVGHGLRINGVDVVFTNTTLDSVVAAINGKGIPLVTAENRNNYLVITSAAISGDSLEIAPGVGSTYFNGTACADLGLATYSEVQLITHPASTANEFFGTAIKISADDLLLTVSSFGARNLSPITFDTLLTIFDSNSTEFYSAIENSGAVYVFDLIHNPLVDASESKFEFSQQLTSNSITSGSNFGSSVAICGNAIYVGVSADSSVVTAGGSVIEFTNVSGHKGWNLIRFAEPQIDYSSISRAYIYASTTARILARLDVFDPAKGKLLGVTAQELDYICEQDPAVYNNGDTNFSSNFHWSNVQTGRIWWDTSSIRYLNYEQDSLEYRNTHWGEMFPGSVVSVYEWVESDVAPSYYDTSNGNGTPKFIDNSNFVTVQYVEAASSTIRSKYYFWVVGKTTANVNVSNRVNSAFAIQQILMDPKDQAIPYIAAISSDTFSLFNVAEYAIEPDSVLHIDHSPSTATNIIHSEYVLIKENSAAAPIPESILAKLLDSLTGINAAGHIVPDPKLGAADRYGIDLRPRQTMFVNRSTALENFVNYVNSIFKLTRISGILGVSNMFSGEPAPIADSGLWDSNIASKIELNYLDTNKLNDGYTVLINSDSDNDNLWAIYRWVSGPNQWELVQIQSHNSSQYCRRIDWYASTYDISSTPTYTVAIYPDIGALLLAPGDIVKVLDNGDGNFAIFEVSLTLELVQVASGNGTVEILSSLYDLANNNMGFDADNFDTVRFDKNPMLEARVIVSTVIDQILVGELQIELNKLFFSLVNYIFTEQAAPDWIFKSSFISVTHKIRELAQFSSFIKDNQTYYEDYINEVKPYRTSIREYLPSYYATDYAYASATDFSQPSYYDTISSTYRSPDGTYDSDAAMLLTPAYADWHSNHMYKITDISVAAGGTGYTLIPMITLTGGGGTGAKATAIVSNGSITSVTVTSTGSGYLTMPTVSINGNGNGAILVPVMRNEPGPTAATGYNTIRNITTSLKFDRTTYNSSSVEWAANTAYTATLSSGTNASNVWLASGTLVSNTGSVYLPLAANVITESTFDSSLYTVINSGNALLNASDRIIGYYTPGLSMPGKVLSQLINGVTYPGTGVSGSMFTANTSIVTVSNVLSFFSTNNVMITSDVSAINFVNAGYEPNQLLTISGSAGNNNRYRIVAVTATSVMLGGATVANSFATGATITYLSDSDVNSIDSVISSTYNNLTLGTRPEDISITGGDYVDLHHSHAPEELVPGQVTDTIDIKVFTANTYGFSSNAFTISRINIQDGGQGYVAGNISLYIPGMTDARLRPHLAANGAITSVTIESGGYALTSNSNPTIYVHGSNVSSAVVTAHVSQQLYDLVGYRYFYTATDTTANLALNNTANLSANLTYSRISTVSNTVLTANLNLTDTVVHVANAGVLSSPMLSLNQPGAIFVNGEKIVFYTVDLVNNTLGTLRRGVDGTGSPLVHIIGSNIVDGGANQAMPGDINNELNATSWLNLPDTVARNIIDDNGNNLADDLGNVITTPAGEVGVVTDGFGLMGSSTTQAMFIKGLL